jgi:hypothetical protein
MTRDTLIFPMNPHPGHAFGRLSGYIDAYRLYTEKMRKEGHEPLVYLSHSECHGNPTKCLDGYIWHNGGLRWHFEIEQKGTFVNKKLDHVMKTKWARYVPPFRKYDYHPYWFLLRNLSEIKEIPGKKTKGGLALNVNHFWREIEGSRQVIHSSIFRSLEGAPWVVKCAVEPELQSDTEKEADPFRELLLRTIIKRGGIDEQTIEETFLLNILWEGFDRKSVDAIWEQEGFRSEAELYRFDLAFKLVNGAYFAVEFKKGFGEDAPLQLKEYINKSPILRNKKPTPIIVCARKTKNLIKEMKTKFPKTQWRIIEFRPVIHFEDVTP